MQAFTTPSGAPLQIGAVRDDMRDYSLILFGEETKRIIRLSVAAQVTAQIHDTHRLAFELHKLEVY